MSDTAKHRALLLLCALAGVLLVAAPWDNYITIPRFPTLEHSLQKIPVSLGEALIIAIFLIVLVDSAAKRRLLREFAEDVSLHIIGRWLPTELRSYLEEYLAFDIVRKSWTIRYNIEQCPGHAQYFRLFTYSDSDLENHGNRDRLCPARFEVEESFYPELGDAKILSCSAAAESCVDNSEIDPNDYDSFGYPTDNKLPQTVENNSQVIAGNLKIPAGFTFRLKAEFVEWFRDGSSIPFFSTYPVLSTELIVNYPSQVLDVFVDLSYGDIGSDASFEPIETGGKWIFKKPMLPGQGFSVRVYEKKTKKPASVPQRVRGKRRKSGVVR
jgi:hypothetical protein